jgi:hypothetical protein
MIEIAQMAVAQYAETMIKRHTHDVVVASEIGTVRAGAGSKANGETTAMNPDHYRSLFAVAQTAREHIHDQTIFAVRSIRIAAVEHQRELIARGGVGRSRHNRSAPGA